MWRLVLPLITQSVLCVAVALQELCGGTGLGVFQAVQTGTLLIPGEVRTVLRTTDVCVQTPNQLTILACGPGHGGTDRGQWR